MSNIFESHYDNAKDKPSLHKRFGGEDYFWCGKYKDKRKGGILLHYAAIAGNMGYKYRIEKLSDISNMTFNKVTRYNLWCRRK